MRLRDEQLSEVKRKSERFVEGQKAFSLSISIKALHCSRFVPFSLSQISAHGDDAISWFLISEVVARYHV